MPNKASAKLTHAEREKIRKFVEVYYAEIGQKWEDFKAGKRIRPKRICKEIK